jgi:PAS domain S-box-containing protein
MAEPASVLLVDPSAALDGAAELLARRGVPLEKAAAADPVFARAARAGPAVVVIGPAVAYPAATARRVRDRFQQVQLLFVAPEAAHDSLRRTLLYSAPANTPWRLVGPDAEEIAQAVAGTLESVGRARAVRTTLDRVNLRLAAPAPSDANAWRRLVVSDHYLASVLRHAQDAIISLDLRGNVLSWNEGATRMFGRKPQQAVGESIDRVVPWSGSVQALAQAAVREGHVTSELRCRVEGEERTVEATLTAIEEEGAQVLAIAAIFRDISERVRTAAVLAQNEARFRAVADNIPQLAWMTDASGAIVWYNRRWFEYTGTTFEEMAGWGWTAVHHPDHLERVIAKFKSHLATGEAWEDIFPLRSSGGEFRWFLSRAFPIRDAQGQVLQWFGTNTDITEQRAAEEALREADRRKNEFIRMLSHELRNPLAPIRNSIQVLDLVDAGSPNALRARQVIRRQVDHLTRLVDDLLDVTRVTSGKMVLAKASHDLAAVVRAAVEDHRALFDSQGLRLEAALPDEPVEALVDAPRITQLLGNLLQNALKFTPAGGWVRVSMRAEGGRARIEVHDSGVGIEPALLGRLFEPFVQGEHSLERSNGGLGLGLALARGVADLHGGTLQAHSDGINQGAQFILLLPVGAVAGRTQPPAPAASEPSPGPRPLSVLVVDDNRDAGESMAVLVELLGHRAEVAYEGRDGVARILEKTPDVVFCDIGLPGMNGYELATRVRERASRPYLVAVSGYAQADDLERAAAAGFDQHIAKPATMEKLRSALDAAAKRLFPAPAPRSPARD